MLNSALFNDTLYSQCLQLLKLLLKLFNSLYSLHKLIYFVHLHSHSYNSNVCRKTSQIIGVIMRLRNLIPTEAKLQLYKSAILPHLTYCHLVWHFCRASDTRKLERVQEPGMRAVFRDNQSSYNQLLERAKLPTLHNRRLQDICILMCKVKHNLCPRTVCNIFKTSNHSYSLRQTDFYLPNFNTVTYGKHSLRYLGSKLWSKLASSERSSASLYNFKLQKYESVILAIY